MRDIHLHLSGATPAWVLYEIVRESGYKIGQTGYQEFVDSISMSKDKVKDLNSYIQVLHNIDDAQSSPMAVEKSVYHSFVSAFLSGCDYLELRWNPYKRSQKGRIDLDELIVSARAGMERAKKIFGMSGGLILCLGRDVSPEFNEGVFKKAVQYFNKGIDGIDVAGPEDKKLEQEFKYYYKTANILKMITTIHVGEIMHDNLEDEFAQVLEQYKPQRVGHGIQLIKFPKLIKIAQKLDPLFEICISSNLATGAVESIEEMSNILYLFETHGLKYCINTDSTFPLDTNIIKEHVIYEQCKSLWNKNENIKIGNTESLG